MPTHESDADAPPRTALLGFSASPFPPNGLGMEKADAAGTPAALTAADTPATAARRRKAARLTGASPPSPAPMRTHEAGGCARRSVGRAAGTNAMAAGEGEEGEEAEGGGGGRKAVWQGGRMDVVNEGVTSRGGGPDGVGKSRQVVGKTAPQHSSRLTGCPTRTISPQPD